MNYAQGSRTCRWSAPPQDPGAPSEAAHCAPQWTRPSCLGRPPALIITGEGRRMLGGRVRSPCSVQAGAECQEDGVDHLEARQSKQPDRLRGSRRGLDKPRPYPSAYWHRPDPFHTPQPHRWPHYGIPDAKVASPWRPGCTATRPYRCCRCGSRAQRWWCRGAHPPGQGRCRWPAQWMCK